jgi:hypothetical protein
MHKAKSGRKVAYLPSSAEGEPPDGFCFFLAKKLSPRFRLCAFPFRLTGDSGSTNPTYNDRSYFTEGDFLEFDLETSL